MLTVAPGERFGRIYHGRYPDPLGFGKTPSRFSDPRRRSAGRRFGVLYLGSSLKVCFVEALLRDQRDGLAGDLPLEERALMAWNYAVVEVVTALSLVDLRNDGPLRMGIPSDVVRGKRQGLARRWSLAFHGHPARPDGVIYPSRLNGETNVAIYDRSLFKVEARSVGPLMREPWLAHVLDALRVSLI
jgi:hypothetical protein